MNFNQCEAKCHDGILAGAASVERCDLCEVYANDDQAQEAWRKRLHPTSPCQVEVTHDEDGGVNVEIFIPTYEGGASFTFSVIRGGGGDWVAFPPWWPEDLEASDEPQAVGNGYESAPNGLLYLGAPDVPVGRK